MKAKFLNPYFCSHRISEANSKYLLLKIQCQICYPKEGILSAYRLFYNEG